MDVENKWSKKFNFTSEMEMNVITGGFKIIQFGIQLRKIELLNTLHNIRQNPASV
jgi:hypothetical protein